MRVNNMTKKPLAAFARYGYSYFDDGLAESGEVLTQNVFFYGNTQTWKGGVILDIQEYFNVLNEYRRAFVTNKQIPEFSFPEDDPSIPVPLNELFDIYIEDWFIYDYEVGRWFRVETQNPYIYSQRGLKHVEYNLYFTTDLDPIIRDRFESDPSPIPAPNLVDDFENNVTELNLITPLVINFLENN